MVLTFMLNTSEISTGVGVGVGMHEKTKRKNAVPSCHESQLAFVKF